MTTLKPWADGPFELIVHAQLHIQDGSDFDRRIALISFDNAIEVAITTYLSLDPIQRGNRQYQNADVGRWLGNYHCKLDFFFHEMQSRGVNVDCKKDEIVWCHNVRNDQYHEGGPTIPGERVLTEIRKAALEVFSTLFEVMDVEDILTARVAELKGDNLPKRDGQKDRLIDSQFGTVEVAGMQYYTSEILFGVDRFAYGNVASGLVPEETLIEGSEPEDEV